MGNELSLNLWLPQIIQRITKKHPLADLLAATTPETLADIFLFWDTLKAEHKLGNSVTVEEFTRFAKRHYLADEIDAIFRWLGTNPIVTCDAKRHSKDQRRNAPVSSLKVDMLEVFSIMAITSRRLSDASKVKFLFALFDFDKDQTITQPECVLMVRAILRAIARLAGGEGQNSPSSADVASQVSTIVPRGSEQDSSEDDEFLQPVKIHHFQVWVRSNPFAQKLLDAFRPVTALGRHSLPTIQHDDTRSIALTQEEILLAFKLWLHMRDNAEPSLSDCVTLVQKEAKSSRIEERVSDEGGNFARLLRKDLRASLRLRDVLQTLSPGASRADLDWYAASLDIMLREQDTKEARCMKREIADWHKLPQLPWEKRSKYLQEFKSLDTDGDGFLSPEDWPREMNKFGLDKNMKMSQREFLGHRSKMERIRTQGLGSLKDRLELLATMEPDNMDEPTDINKFHTELYRELSVMSETDAFALKDIFDSLARPDEDGELRVDPNELSAALPQHLLNALLSRYDMCQRGLTRPQFLEMCFAARQRLPLHPNPSKMPRYFGTMSTSTIAKHWQSTGNLCRNRRIDMLAAHGS